MTPRNRVVVIGVDTHAETHTAAAVDELGRILDVIEIPSTPAGHRRLLRWAWRLGRVERAGVEGTGAYGAGLARFLIEHDIAVVEVNRTNRHTGDDAASQIPPTLKRLLGRCSPATPPERRRTRPAASKRSGCCTLLDALPSRPKPRPPTRLRIWC